MAPRDTSPSSKRFRISTHTGQRICVCILPRSYIYIKRRNLSFFPFSSSPYIIYVFLPPVRMRCCLNEVESRQLCALPHTGFLAKQELMEQQEDP